MEQKCLKTSVYVNEVVYNETAEQPIDVDFTLPDYCADISKIFKCRAVSRISSKGINGKNIFVDGTIYITVLYADENFRLCSYEYQYPFNKNLEMTEECSSGNLICHSKCEYINCRAVTGRKVDIHGAVGIHCKVVKRKSTDIISDIDDHNIEQRRVIAPATIPMGYSEKYLIIEEEILLGQGQPLIQNILRYDAKSCVKECKIINDKIVVKGDMTVSILYCPDGNMTVPQLVKTTIPYSQIIDMEGVTDCCECETKSYIAFLEVKPRSSVSGELKSFSLTAKILLCSEAFCGNDVAVILDAYSRKYQASIKKNNICFEKIVDNISETYHCKKNLEVENTISTISDLWCDMQSVSTKFENKNMLVNGTLIVGMIISDNENRATYCEKVIDFDYKYEVNNLSDTMRCNPEIEVISAGYTITGANNIELRVDLGINAAIYQCNNMSLIVDMEIDENRLNERRAKGAMTIYFASENELVWDIAHHYNASVEEIMKINNLESDELTQGRMILVPMI